LFLGRSRWSLGLSLFLEFLLALSMLQGSVFLLFVHVFRTKSVLWNYCSILEESPEGENPEQNQKIKGEKSK